MCSELDPLSHFQRLQMGIFGFFYRKRLEPRMLPWQQHKRCHSDSFVIYISGAKFEEHYTISGDTTTTTTTLLTLTDILDRVLYCFNPPLISRRFLEYFRVSENTKINHMRSNHRNKIAFQDIVYFKFNK